MGPDEGNEPATGNSPRPMLPPSGTWAGILHIFVAFDWGEEIELQRARRRVPAEVHELPRRLRTPSSIAYRPPPLRFQAKMNLPDLPEVGPTCSGRRTSPRERWRRRRSTRSSLVHPGHEARDLVFQHFGIARRAALVPDIIRSFPDCPLLGLGSDSNG